jgi:hypothetical protein
MYEKPELTRVGDAEETILGCGFDGGDLDMNWAPGGGTTLITDTELEG